MFSPRIARFRAAMILALAVLFSSDAALASFVCPHMSGCEHGMPASGSSNAANDASAGAMPCCPVKPESSMECSASAMECCAWHHSDSDVSAILSASDHPRPKQLVAVLSSVASPTPSLMARAHLPGLADHHSYIKPVTQKKTDLRI